MLTPKDLVILRVIKEKPLMSGYEIAKVTGLRDNSVYDSLEKLFILDCITAANEITAKGLEIVEFHQTAEVPTKVGSPTILDRKQYNQYSVIPCQQGVPIIIDINSKDVKITSFGDAKVSGKFGTL